jgi:uncharacterized protein (TIGR02145 family)
VKLYASYIPGNSSETKYAYLDIRVEDGTCICPAKTAPFPEERWLNFMCHNLGGLDIISPSQLITREHHGDWYRFGVKNPSALRTSTDGEILNWAYFPVYDENDDWPAAPATPDDPFGDPCPAGWRLPTYPELLALITFAINNNTHAIVPASWTYNDDAELFSHLKKIDNLMLPVAGWRHYLNNGPLTFLGQEGYYWSSRSYDIGSYSSYLNIPSLSVSGWYRTVGMSVRCVEAE